MGVLLMKVILIRSQVSPDATVLPTSCREVVYPTATNPIDCARVTRGDIGMVNDLLPDDDWDTVADVGGTPVNGFYDTILKQWVQSPTGQNPSGNPVIPDSGKSLLPDELPGSCRWDMERSNRLGNSEACMCPATKFTCSTGDREGKCWWHQVPEVSGKAPTKACLNNAERFYYLLDKLLKKRGKSDFAIKLKYAADPVKYPLPLENPLLRRVMMINMMGGMMKTNYLSPYGQSTYRSPYGQSYRSPYGQSYRSPYGQPYSSPYGQSFGSPYGQKSNPAFPYPSYIQPNATQTSVNQNYPPTYYNYSPYNPYQVPPPSPWSSYQSSAKSD